LINNTGQLCYPAPNALPVVGLTAPSRQATLSAIQPGRLSRMAATEGSPVNEGDLVFELDDGGQEARTLMAEAEAASTLEIELAEARWEQARRELERVQRLVDAASSDFASRKELADAQSAERIRSVELQLARFAHRLRSPGTSANTSRNSVKPSTKTKASFSSRSSIRSSYYSTAR
jgi:multidrug efflux pump subunit AcrA (membrane-fusion protein)